MAWNLLTSVTGQSPAGGGAFTTSSIDSSGADLIVVAVSDFDGIFSDSKGNSYTSIGPVGTQTASNRATIFAVWHPTVGTGHTFSMAVNVGNPRASLVALAYSGSLVASTAIDQSTGAENGVGGATTIQPGSITPGADGELLICIVSGSTAGNDLSINLGFTELSELAHSADHYGLAVASLTQGTAAAINPTWTNASSVEMAAIIASFKVEPTGTSGVQVVRKIRRLVS